MVASPLWLLVGFSKVVAEDRQSHADGIERAPGEQISRADGRLKDEMVRLEAVPTILRLPLVTQEYAALPGTYKQTLLGLHGGTPSGREASGTGHA
jgi:hypothetical protein